MTESPALRRYLPAVAGFLAVAAVLAATRNGMGLSPDSVQYLAASRSALSMKGFLSYDGAPLVLWPPVYPALLAFLGAGGIGALDAARFINAASYGLVVFVAVSWLSGNVRRTSLLVPGAVLVLLSAPLFRVSLFALSETTFALFALLSIYWAGAFVQREKTRPALYLSAIFAALSCMDRYIGVSVVIAVSLLLFCRSDAPARERVRDATVFGIVSLLPLGLWLWRNYAAAGMLTGERGASAYGLLANLWFTLDVASSWFLPVQVPTAAKITAAALLPSAVFLALGGHAGRAQSLVRTRPFFYFVLIYLACLVALSSRAAFDRMDYRLLSPVYVPLTVAGCAVADAIMDKRGRRAGGIVAAALVCLWLAYPLTCAAEFLSSGRSYVFNAFISSRTDCEAARFLKGQREGARIYSNAPEAVYMLTGREVKCCPRKYYYNSPSKAPDIETFKETLAGGSRVYLAWFDDDMVSKRDYYSPKELGGTFELSPVLTSPRGSVYTVRAGTGLH